MIAKINTGSNLYSALAPFTSFVLHLEQLNENLVVTNLGSFLY